MQGIIEGIINNAMDAIIPQVVNNMTVSMGGSLPPQDRTFLKANSWALTLIIICGLFVLICVAAGVWCLLKERKLNKSAAIAREKRREEKRNRRTRAQLTAAPIGFRGGPANVGGNGYPSNDVNMKNMDDGEKVGQANGATGSANGVFANRAQPMTQPAGTMAATAAAPPPQAGYPGAQAYPYNGGTAMAAFSFPAPAAASPQQLQQRGTPQPSGAFPSSNSIGQSPGAGARAEGAGQAVATSSTAMPQTNDTNVSPSTTSRLSMRRNPQRRRPSFPDLPPLPEDGTGDAVNPLQAPNTAAVSPSALSPSTGGGAMGSNAAAVAGLAASSSSRTGSGSNTPGMMNPNMTRGASQVRLGESGAQGYATNAGYGMQPSSLQPGTLPGNSHVTSMMGGDMNNPNAAAQQQRLSYPYPMGGGMPPSSGAGGYGYGYGYGAPSASLPQQQPMLNPAARQGAVGGYGYGYGNVPGVPPNGTGGYGY